MLNAHNSKHELSIEKYLTKSEEAFFDKVRKDKLSSAASVRSSQRESVWGAPSFDYDRPSCKSPSRSAFALMLIFLQHLRSPPVPEVFKMDHTSPVKL